MVVLSSIRFDDFDEAIDEAIEEDVRETEGQGSFSVSLISVFCHCCRVGRCNTLTSTLTR